VGEKERRTEIRGGKEKWKREKGRRERKTVTYSPLPGLWEEKVRQDTLDESPGHEDDVRLPLDLLDGNGPGELVEQAGGVDEEGLEGHALGADLERDAFDRVEGLQGGDVERVHGAEDEDKSQHGIAGVLVGEDGVAVVDAAGRERLRERAGRGGHAHPHDRDAEEAGQHHPAAADLLDEMRPDHGEDELFDAVPELHVGLADGPVDAGGVEDGRHELTRAFLVWKFWLLPGKEERENN
jgi:hypothetical protein